MYLSDEETEQLLQKSLSWLKPNGTLFFRESCFHSSGELYILHQKIGDILITYLSFVFIGNIKPDENPTHYRSPRQYIDMCQSRILSDQPHEQVYELVFAKALESYYEIKQNNNQVKIEDGQNKNKYFFSFM
jgi:phosphoethanolamine N-methyltransferase